MQMKKYICFGILCLVGILGFVSNEADAAGELIESAFVSGDIQDKENIAIQKYNLLLKEWAYNPLNVDDINANFPDYYGGAYINEDKKLVINTTELNDNVLSEIGNIIDLTDVEFVEVEYSFEQLKEEQMNIVNRLSSDVSICSADEYIEGIGISVKNNSVYVQADTSSQEEMLLVTEGVDETLSILENVIIVDSPKSKIQPRDVVNVPLNPGNTILDSAGRIRSVGFWAKKSNGDIGIITAPHGLLSRGETMRQGTVTFGVCDTPYTNGNIDAVFVKRTNSNVDPSRIPAGFSFSLKSNAYTTLPEGATVYQSGTTTGAKVGTVTDISYYSSNLGISDLVVLSSTCLSGDSGGVIAGAGSSTSKYVAGIIIGGKGNQNYTLYVKVSKIISTLGVSVY